MSGMKQFQVLKKLGEGAFGNVFLVKRITDGVEYAMKKVKMVSLSEKERSGALNEVRILASIQHPNVISYKESFFEDQTSSLCIVMECADGGDLLAKIASLTKQRRHMTEEQAWSFFIQLVRGLGALHDIKIVHRDIKCANLFLTKSGEVKLGDLNVSKVSKGRLLKTQTGTPYYASPEVWSDKPYDFKSDIWSVGCVLFEMCAQQPPFKATDMQQLFRKITSGKVPSLPSQYSKDLNHMVKLCLQQNPSLRPSCADILAKAELLKNQAGLPKELKQDQEGSAFANDKEMLINTIKVPRNLGQITDRLPKANYEPSEEFKAGRLLRMRSHDNVPNLDNVNQRAAAAQMQVPGSARHAAREPRGLANIKEAPAKEEYAVPQSANLRRTRSFDPQAGAIRANEAKGYNNAKQPEREPRRYGRPNAIDAINDKNIHVLSKQEHYAQPKISSTDPVESRYNLPPIGKGAYEYNNVQYKQRDHSSGSRLRQNGANIMNAPIGLPSGGQVASAHRLPSQDAAKNRLYPGEAQDLARRQKYQYNHSGQQQQQEQQPMGLRPPRPYEVGQRYNIPSAHQQQRPSSLGYHSNDQQPSYQPQSALSQQRYQGAGAGAGAKPPRPEVQSNYKQQYDQYNLNRRQGSASRGGAF